MNTKCIRNQLESKSNTQAVDLGRIRCLNGMRAQLCLHSSRAMKLWSERSYCATFGLQCPCRFRFGGSVTNLNAKKLLDIKRSSAVLFFTFTKKLGHLSNAFKF